MSSSTILPFSFVCFSFCLFIWVGEVGGEWMDTRQTDSLTMKLWLVWNLPRRPSWPQTHSNLLASASQVVMGLKACASTPVCPPHLSKQGFLLLLKLKRVWTGSPVSPESLLWSAAPALGLQERVTLSGCSTGARNPAQDLMLPWYALSQLHRLSNTPHTQRAFY